MKDIKTKKIPFFLYAFLLLGCIFLNVLIFSFFPRKLHDLYVKEKIPEETVAVIEEEMVPEDVTLLESMSIEEKVGQLFLFGFEGTTVNDENREVLENCKVGGILLLKRKYYKRESIKKVNPRFTRDHEDSSFYCNRSGGRTRCTNPME